ncbi:tetratricopeptide repeat protein [Sporobolomyces salmoneus]|uniref:tetratricopeptide repeat protein n=1 Tax=Sporobolomyces salmoneus TaxID=183962 RepID=UPI003175640F
MSSKEEYLAIIAKAVAVREGGNQKFKDGDYPGALRDYYTVLLSLRGLSAPQGLEGKMQIFIPPKPPVDILGNARKEEGGSPKKKEQAKEKKDKEPEGQDPYEVIKQALLNTHINSAAIHIKLERWQRALQCAQEAQRIDEKSPKAAFREAQARLGLGQIEKAKTIFERLQKTLGPDAGITRTLAEIEAEEKRKDVDHLKNSKLRGFLHKPTTKPEEKTAEQSSSSAPGIAQPATASASSSSGTSESTLQAKSDQVSKEAESVAQQVRDEVAVKQAQQAQDQPMKDA